MENWAEEVVEFKRDVSGYGSALLTMEIDATKSVELK